MEMGKETKRFLKAVFVGGPLAIVTLGAFVAVIAIAGSSPIDYLYLIMNVVVLAMASIATVWATGFWGRWGMIVFFTLAPVLIVIDFSINPLFPSGVIAVASILYGGKCVLRSDA